MKFFGEAWSISKIYFIYMIVNILIKGFLPLVNIMIPKLIINELTDEQEWFNLIRYVLEIVGINFFANTVMNILENRMQHFEQGFSNHLKEKLGNQSMNIDYNFIENHSDMQNFERAKCGMFWYSGGLTNVSRAISIILSNIITIICIINVIISTRQIYILIVGFVVGFFAFSEKMNSKYDLTFFREMIKFNREFRYYTGIIKNFQFGKEIRLFSAQNLIMSRLDKYRKYSDEIFKNRAKQKSITALWLSFVYLVFQISMYISICIQIVSDKITIGDFSLLSSAYNNFLDKCNEIMSQYFGLVRSLDLINDYYNYFEWYKIEEDVKEDSKYVQINDFKDYIIEFQNVSFAYPGTEKTVLKNVNLRIQPNQKISIVGRNGAGKTTFIKLLIGLYRPTEGKILINGINAEEISRKDRFHIFGVVFQDYQHYPISIYDNVMLNQEVDETKFWDIMEKIDLNEFVKKLPEGKDTLLYKQFSERGVELSGGQAQKLAIARALYKNAKILILDEPTSALDPQTEFEINQKIHQVESVKNVIFISHRLSSCRICDRTIVFHKGEIVQDGHHNELIEDKNGIYYKLFQSQSQYYTN